MYIVHTNKYPQNFRHAFKLAKGGGMNLMGTSSVNPLEIFWELDEFQIVNLCLIIMSTFEGSTNRVERNESFDSFASVDFLVESLPVEEEKEGKLEPSAMRLKELAGEIFEPLLAEDKNRFVLFPIKHHDVSVESVFILRISFYLPNC